MDFIFTRQTILCSTLILLCSLLGSPECLSQDEEDIADKGGFLLYMSYGAHLPGGDLKDRFGHNFSPGLHVEFLFPSSSLSAGLEATYQFGREVKTDVLAPLRNEQGFVLNDNGGFADVVLRERGLYIGAYGSKFWAGNSEKGWSGWNLTMGAGILQHNIRIQNNTRDVSFLIGESEKGYDRLSNGLAGHLAFGYQYLRRDQRINYYIGLELIAGSTKNRRSWNYDTNEDADASRFDMHFGLRAAWILPFYTTSDPETIYY